MAEGDQFIRRVSLMLVEGDKALVLDELHFKFATVQADEESPDNVSIRVWNLAADTVRKIKGEYSRVVLQAGYADSSFGVIFDGTIKQYRTGKEQSGLDTYLDILAADGDLAYNFAVTATSMAAGTTSAERQKAAVRDMAKLETMKLRTLIPSTGGILPRGKVLFGLSRGIMRSESQNNGATWTINRGTVNVIPLTGYLPGEAVVLTADTGLIGRVEQTEDGMRARCLLNPKITVGGLVRINNGSINTTEAAKGQEVPGAQLAYNRYKGVQKFASVAGDGLYRVYVCEHRGDTRATEYYSDLTCLAVDPATDKVKAFG